MSGTEAKIGDLTYSKFLKNIEGGSVKCINKLNKIERNLFWKTIHSVNNLKDFCYLIHDFKKDLEENIPKMIKDNHFLKVLQIHISSETCEFKPDNLYQTLQKRIFKCLSIHYKSNMNFDIYDVKIDEDQYYLESLLGCFENSTILNLTLHNLSLNDQVLKRLEKININEIEFSSCKVINTLKYSIQASNVVLYYILSIQEDFIYKFIENFSNLQDLHLLPTNYSLDFLKLKRSLNDLKLKNLSLFQFNYHKNEDYFKDILINIINEVTIQCELSFRAFEFPIFTYLKDNKSLKSFNGEFLENYIDLDEFLQNNQSIQKLKLTMNSYKQYKNFEENIQKLGLGISKNHSLEHLHLEIPLNKGFEYFYKGMVNNINLKNLELSFCDMNDQVCKLLGDYLNKNSSLTNLKISTVKLSDIGIKLILNGLMKHKSLKSLNLCHISIQEDVYECFKELLISNQHLVELRVIQSSLKEKILKTISEGLLHNSSLTELFLEIQSIETSDFDFIFYGFDDFKINLFYNYSLKNIDFGYYLKIDLDTYITSILKRNSNFIQTPKEFLTIIHYDIHFNFI